MASRDSARNGAKSLCDRMARSASTTRAGLVAVDPRTAMPGNVLDDRQHAARQEDPRRKRWPRPRHARRLAAEGAVADHRVGVARRQVEHRGTVHRDARLGQIVGDQPGAKPRRLGGERLRQCRDLRRRRVEPPIRRPQSGDPAAFLIHQHRRVGPPDTTAQFLDQRAQLIAGLAIAPKQDEAERVRRREKPALLRGQTLAGAAQDNRAR